MNAGELIEKLKEFEPSTEVVFDIGSAVDIVDLVAVESVEFVKGARYSFGGFIQSVVYQDVVQLRY